MLARMSSAEVTGWQALFAAQAQEATEARDRAESGDGEVIYYGDEEPEDDDGDDE